MGAETAISWCDATFNGWWGCSRVSPACANCYAEALAKRTGHDVWGNGGERRQMSDKYWAAPLRWNRDAEAGGRRLRVFCASMADVFEAHPALPPLRDRLWRLIADTPWLDWLLLTKRPENVAGMVPAGYMNGGWPENCGLGATAENPRYARERIPALLACPARFRFLSCEPLLGPLDVDLAGISWLICGGESGAKARPMHPDWARGLRDQCRSAGVAFHFKQWGEYLPVAVDDDAGFAGGRAFDDPRGGGRTAALPGDRRLYRWLGPDLVAVKVGTKAAGRELDGEICDDTPAVTPGPTNHLNRVRGARL